MLPFGTLDFTLEVTIGDDHTDLATTVYRDCVFEIFNLEFSIDLVPILIGDVCVIMGIDLLS